jgi:5-enolpyruvylshikimate-3-phosphate synthase
VVLVKKSSLLLVGVGLVAAAYAFRPKSNIPLAVAQQYSSNSTVQNILTNSSTAGEALTQLQAYYATPLNPALEGNSQNNPPQTPLVQALSSLGVPLTANPNNPAQQARSQIQSWQNSINQLNDEISRARNNLVPGDTSSGSYNVKMGIITQDLAMIETFKNDIAQVQALIG